MALTKLYHKFLKKKNNTAKNPELGPNSGILRPDREACLFSTYYTSYGTLEAFKGTSWGLSGVFLSLVMNPLGHNTCHIRLFITILAMKEDN